MSFQCRPLNCTYDVCFSGKHELKFINTGGRVPNPLACSVQIVNDNSELIFVDSLFDSMLILDNGLF